MNKYLIFVVLIIALITRVWDFGKTPMSLYWEEVALGYDAYSIWKTGKDMHGQSFPLVAFTSYGDYKPIGYFYASVPFVGLLGLNEISVRLPSLIAGLVTIYLVYLITKELYKSTLMAFLSAITLTVMPWHFHLSKAAFEVNLATMLLVASIYFFIKALSKPPWLLLSTLFMVFSIYTYHALKILTPLIGLMLLFIFYRKMIKFKYFWLSMVLGIVLMFPIIINVNNASVSHRFWETSFLSSSKAVERTNALRETFGNSLWSRVVFHRYWFWLGEIVQSSLQHFSTNFLFVRGDGNGRHQNYNYGLLPNWSAIPIIFGSILVFWKKDKFGFILLAWILLATIPPAISLPSPHTLRFLPAAPSVAMLTAYGLFHLIKLTNKSRIVGTTIVIIIFLSFGSYLINYFNKYSISNSVDWQYGYKEMVQYVLAHNPTNDMVQVTRAYGRPAMYFLFYGKIDPAHIQELSHLLPKDQGELLAFDHYKFFDMKTDLKGIIVNDSPIDGLKLEKTIARPDGNVAFYIYRN